MTATLQQFRVITCITSLLVIIKYLYIKVRRQFTILTLVSLLKAHGLVIMLVNRGDRSV